MQTRAPASTCMRVRAADGALSTPCGRAVLGLPCNHLPSTSPQPLRGASEAHFAKEEAEVSGGLITCWLEAPAGKATILPLLREASGQGPLPLQLWLRAFLKGRPGREALRPRLPPDRLSPCDRLLPRGLLISPQPAPKIGH